MLRNAALGLILAASVVFAMVLGGEAMVRIVAGPPAHFLYSGSFRDIQSDWDIVYGVNEASHRATCRHGSPSPGARRFAVIGDSFVFGQGVEDCEVFVSLLAGRADAWDFENLGVVGSGIPAYIVVARDLVDESFDGALVLFYGNDLSSIERNRSLSGRLADRFASMALIRKFERFTQVRGLLAEQAGLQAGDASQVKRSEWTYEGKHNNTIAGLRKDPRVLQRAVDPGREQEALFEQRFATLAAALSESLSPEQIYIAMVPEGHTVSSRLRDFAQGLGGTSAPFAEAGPAYALVKRLAEARSFRFIETFDAFRRGGDALYHPHDLHWTPEGHRTMASLTGRALGIPDAAPEAPEDR